MQHGQLCLSSKKNLLLLLLEILYFCSKERERERETSLLNRKKNIIIKEIGNGTKIIKMIKKKNKIKNIKKKYKNLQHT